MKQRIRKLPTGLVKRYHCYFSPFWLKVKWVNTISISPAESPYLSVTFKGQAACLIGSGSWFASDVTVTDLWHACESGWQWHCAPRCRTRLTSLGLPWVRVPPRLSSVICHRSLNGKDSGCQAAMLWIAEFVCVYVFCVCVCVCLSAGIYLGGG